MKQKMTDQIKEMFLQGKAWLECEAKYITLTAAEKITILLSTLIMGAICLLLGVFALGLFTFALVDVFKMIMSPALAFMCVGGIVLLLILIVFLLRRPLLFNPISRFITKLLLDKK